MAGEEDVELRDLVAQSLEAKGVLGKIRAQLRANVFLALEEQEAKEKPHPFVSEKLQNFQKTKEGRQTVALVREFLEFFQLDFTTAVFDPETNACESYPGREQLARDLGLEPPSNTPLLSSLLSRPHPPSTHHTLPSHAASFPTSFSSSLHHTSHHHHHNITNGNLLPSSSLTSDSAHSTKQVVTATGTLNTHTSVVTTVTGSIATATTTGSKTKPMSEDYILELTEKLTGGRDQSRDTGSASGGGGGGGGGGEEKFSSQQGLDDIFGLQTLPPLSSLPPPPPLAESPNLLSDSSRSDFDDSIASGKTTDVTNTAEQSLHGDYDFQTKIDLEEQ